MYYVNGRFLTQKLTGVQRFAHELTIRLSRLRNDVVVLVPDISSIRNEYLIESLTIHELKGGKGHYWEQITLPLFLKSKPQHLLVNLCNSAPLFYKKKIITQHDITYTRYPKSFSIGFRMLYSLMTPILLRNSTTIVTVSEFSKNEIATFYNCDKNKIHVISNAVSSKFNEGERNRRSDYFLTVSSVNYHKNIHGLVNAILSSDLDIYLKIIGDQTTVFNCIDVNTNDPRISFLGRVTDEELINLYQQAKAFIFPSFYEGFGIPPIEAQSCGCPVISSDRASLKEILNDSALFFDPSSTNEIIDAIHLIDTDKNIRNELIIKGSVNVLRYSWDESAKKLNLLIDELINC
ncbi:glycosyltransferase family 4 protein [Raoultella ornithinolytica]|jgi:glycosyltransferase involved in cell wall biosynthesis|uniref:glycosyltransferase family 4 protein n=1 Tax=Raoultella ornithinolytica TaxID=54291 RepID=UPI0008FF7EF6